MTARTFSRWIAVAGLLGASGVTLGAFGAHALKARLTPEALGWWETAVLYHLVHSLLLVAIGLAMTFGQRRGLSGAAWLITSGVFIFSGSLYAMALGAPRWFGAITPLGGLALIGGWLMLAFSVLVRQRGS